MDPTRRKLMAALIAETTHEGVDVSFAPSLRPESILVTGLEYDSRRVEPGNIFFAFPGQRSDGRAFAKDALAKGATAVASELPPIEGIKDKWLRVSHGRRALALMSRAFYPEVAANVRLVGVTGTNGKTTTSTIIESLLGHAGYTTALVGTIEYHLAGRVLKAVNTTPESLDLYRLYSQLAAAGGTHAVMEVSSHALELGRVWGLPFHTAVFTNLTRDHLDFHGDMESYFRAKARLFEGQGSDPPLFSVVNCDDEWAARLPLAVSSTAIWYGLSANAGLRARNVESSFGGLRFEVEWRGKTWPVQSVLTGGVNVYNILAAWGAGVGLGLTPEVMTAGLKQLRPVPGRFENVAEGQPFLVVVDYAHTDDALRNAIRTARALTTSRVITLFGCGGDRDRTKRPLMGQAAGELSDFVVVTSDNPRSENPVAIIEDALAGLRRTTAAYRVEPDRATAIRAALREARPGDVVLLAGKGHETYQVLKDRTIDFDDRAVARVVLREQGFGKEAT